MEACVQSVYLAHTKKELGRLIALIVLQTLSLKVEVHSVTVNVSMGMLEQMEAPARSAQQGNTIQVDL